LLAVRSAAARPFRGALALPVPWPGWWRVTPEIAWQERAHLSLALAAPPGATGPATWTFDAEPGPLRCAALEPRVIRLEAEATLEVEVIGDGISLDAVALEPASASGEPPEDAIVPVGAAAERR